MTIRTAALVLLAVLFVPVLPGQAGGEGSSPAPAASRKAVVPPPAVLPIAVVDIGRAQVHTKAHGHLQEQLREMSKHYQGKLDEMRDEIQQIEATMQSVTPTSTRYTELEIKRQGGLEKLRFAKERYRLALNRQQAHGQIEIQQELEEKIAALAQERRILLVLRTRPVTGVEEGVKELLAGTDTSSQVDAEAKVLQKELDSALVRDVLYHAAELDITADLIKYLKG